MIRGVHAMFYTSEPEAARAFFRDKLGLPFTDVGEGWLIFDFAEADLGFHPIDTPDALPSGTPLISFYCDDIEKSVAEMKARGVEFMTPIEDHGYGLVTFFNVPGGFGVQLYQPRYVKNTQPADVAVETPGPVNGAARKRAGSRLVAKKTAKRTVAKAAAKRGTKKPTKGKRAQR